VKDGSLAGSQQVLSRVKFDSGIKAHDEHLPIPPVSRGVSPAYYPGEQAATQPRSRQHPHKDVRQHAVEGREADEEALIESPAPTRSLARKRDAIPSTAHDVFPRHRPRVSRASPGRPCVVRLHGVRAGPGSWLDDWERVEIGVQARV